MANVSDKSILTAAGKALLAQLNAEEKALVIDKMIFANVPNRPEYPQPDDVVPTDNVVHQAAVEQRGRLSEDSVIYSTTLASNEGPFEFNWTGAYCSEYGVLVTIDHHSLTPKTVDEPGVSGNTLVRSVVLEYKDIAEITNITVDASTWQYNATPRMKKMDNDVAQANIDQNGKDWFIEDGFLVTPQASAFSIKAGAGYVSGNRVTLEFDRNVQVPNKPSFIYIDAHREGTPTGEQVTLFNFVVSAEEKDDYTDSSTGKDVPHFVCKIAQVLGDGSVSDLRPDGLTVDKQLMFREQSKQTEMLTWGVKGGLSVNPEKQDNMKSKDRLQIEDVFWYAWDLPSGYFLSFVNNNDYGTATLTTTTGVYEFVTSVIHAARKVLDPFGWGAKGKREGDSTLAINAATLYAKESGGGAVTLLEDYRITDTVHVHKGVNLVGTNATGKADGSNLFWDPNGNEAVYRLKPVVKYTQSNQEFLDALPRFKNFGITSTKKAVAGIMIDGSVAPVAWWNIVNVVINPDDGTDYNTPSDQFLFGIWSAKGFSWQVKDSFYIRNCVIGIHQMGNDCTSSSVKNGFISMCRYHLVAEGLTGFVSNGMSYEGSAKKRIVIGNNKAHFSNSCMIQGYMYGWDEEHSLYVDADIREIYHQINSDYNNWYSEALQTIGMDIPTTIKATEPCGIKVSESLLSGKVHKPSNPAAVTTLNNVYTASSDRSFETPMLQDLLSEWIAGGAEQVSAFKYRREDASYNQKDINYIAKREAAEFAISFNYPDDVVLAEFSVTNVDTRFALITVAIDSLDDSYNSLSATEIQVKARVSYTGSGCLIDLVSTVPGDYLYIREKTSQSKVASIGSERVSANHDVIYELVADTNVVQKGMTGVVRCIRHTNGATCDLRV
ncbi:phage tail protein [Vibrio splendidus]|uniref:phage tail-collar fiber domain-containing protein n=1 Tax=Vibrio splendidus TaxID=29497 RepID=UPI00006710A7|nr:phage tail protein [Vibrio splendidus]EAP92915.1 Phage-related tail fiber protein [Vibrio splendidus 12B01]